MTATYCLSGVMETGSCLRLSPDGSFDYFLAYGAYDESAHGRWRVDGGDIVLDTPAYDKRPTFSLKRVEKTEDGYFNFVVESTSGQPLTGIDVRVDCGGREIDAGYTGGGSFNVDCTEPLKSVSLAIRMYNVDFQKVDLAANAGPEHGYVFAFDPGDLGKKRFAGTRLKIADRSTLVMTYADTPIREFDGLEFTYKRE